MSGALIGAIVARFAALTSKRATWTRVLNSPHPPLAPRMDSAAIASSDMAFDPPPLSARAIEGWLRDAGGAHCAVEVVDETASTNADLMVRARAQQLPQPVLRATEFQYEGRGRQGRPWYALPRHALLFSVGLPLAELPASLPAITLACGVSLAECFAERGVDIQLKWPNDLRIGGRKLGGVLSELASDDQARFTLVIGIGINLHLEPSTRQMIDQPALGLDEVLPPPVVAAEREAWIGRLAAAVLQTHERFTRQGFAAFRPRYNALLEGRGRPVDVVENGAVVAQGRLSEVDGHGRLMIDVGSGAPRLVSVGDLVFRDSGP
jgi:BirA family biotin operon repressor/biotin-[acetyl-CoA-carboxylase] ligase